ncbi:cytochrome d ubiquinol oxidase subunit II [Paraconexibacter algicola]|uniref:Cytochrome d ubiquinol oxidase subunit II n=1 Tax=Paraconexibacter algicola TaxID=2133960 RepID=A0A2T4UDK2_9ACTN|nr:cytochrome d ubiquinol oxidase subunit II [Paraconexibacter algicola]PTL55555.1 cytochrome d ubiquinol oxidase subunit II [Paraconexibacter algicola]
MSLVDVWFVLIAVLWAGYLILEGFDFGVGTLLHLVGRTPAERAQALRTIGPVWDGNEVWLLVAGGATFAAFPEWYATLFSGYYLALTVILVALIVRIMALEYRNKHDDPAWRRRWDAAIVVSSALPAVLWGVAFANIVGGSPLAADGSFAGNVLDLLRPYTVLGGLTTLSLFCLHGAHFLALRTEGPVRDRATALATRMWAPTVLVVAGFAVWTLADAQVVRPLAVGGTAAAALALLAVLPAHRAGREGRAFALTTVAIAGAVVLLFATLFPDVMVSSGPGPDLTMQAAASTDRTLTVMTVVAAVMTPVVLLYQGWTYWVFRARVRPEGTGDVRTPLDLLDRRAGGVA